MKAIQLKGNRFVLWGSVATLGVIAVGLIVNHIHKANVQKAILDIINNGGDASIDTSAAFDNNYWKTSTDPLLTVEQANNYAVQINGDYGYWGSNDSDIISVIKSLQNKAQVSQVSFYFNENYGQDLLTFLKDSLDRSTGNVIRTITGSFLGNLLGAGSDSNYKIVSDYITSLS